MEWRSIKLSCKLNEKFDVDAGSDEEWNLFVLIFHLFLASEATGNFIVRLVSVDKALEHITDHLLT